MQKAGAPPVRWVLTRQGYEVPPGAVRSGGSFVVARTLSSNSNDGNIIPGFADTTGGIDGVGAKLGKLLYDDTSNAAHKSNQWNATDFEIACCGSDAECNPTPPKPAVYHHPWVRFAHAIPAPLLLSAVIDPPAHVSLHALWPTSSWY